VVKFRLLISIYETDINPTLKCQQKRAYQACNLSGCN